MMRVPLRALRSIFCTTSLCDCGQYQPDLQLPAVDDIADEIDLIGFVLAQEAQQLVGLASARAKVNIGNEKRAVLLRFGSHVVRVRPCSVDAESIC